MSTRLPKINLKTSHSEKQEAPNRHTVYSLREQSCELFCLCSHLPSSERNVLICAVTKNQNRYLKSCCFQPHQSSSSLYMLQQICACHCHLWVSGIMWHHHWKDCIWEQNGDPALQEVRDSTGTFNKQWRCCSSVWRSMLTTSRTPGCSLLKKK